MSAYIIKLPDVGEGIAEAEIVAWHVSVGDTIGEDDAVVEVMTDKATVELPSPVAGTITRLGAEIGDLVPVGTELIWIEVDGPSGEGALVDGAATGGRVVNGSSVGGVAAGGASGDAAQPTADPLGAELASESQLAPDMQPSTSAGVGPAAVAVPRASTAAAPAPAPARSAAPAALQRKGASPLAAPAVRGRANALGIDLADVTGTGPDGRISHADLDAFVTSSSSTSAVSKLMAAAPSRPAADSIESVKIIGLRRNIAQRMRIAKNHIPHFTYVDEIDMTELERLRTQLNAERTELQPKLTMLPLLMRAVVVAVGDFPQMNARFDDDAGVIQRHGSVHLGIASQTPKGLMVPVLKYAETHDVWSSATEVARLSSAARAGTIKLDELSGSTITISSLGAIGGIVSTPIINYPEVAIIGVNKIAVRPVYVGGHWLPRQIMNLSSSFDHRVVDGVDAAEFIQRIKALLETPALMFITPSR